jgi:transposase
MGKAIALPLRQRIVELKQQGHSLQAISQQLDLRLAAVRLIWSRFKQLGQPGLLTRFDQCGPQPPFLTNPVFRAARWLRHRHPQWGSPLIQTLLHKRYGQDVPSIRTLNRWYKQAGLTPARSKPNPVVIGRAKAVHNIWQVDAKEHVVLGNAQPSCYLTITDEHSGAWLTSLVFPL